MTIVAHIETMSRALKVKLLYINREPFLLTLFLTLYFEVISRT